MKERIGCIYEITCLETKRKYIGRSMYKHEYRFLQHVEKSKSKKSDSYNNPLQKAIRQYGEDKFEIRVLATCIFREHYELNAIEQKYIEFFNTKYPHGYNVSGLVGEDLKEYKRQKGCV